MTREEAGDAVVEEIQVEETVDAATEKPKRGPAKGAMLAGGVGLVVLSAMMMKRRKRGKMESMPEEAESALADAGEPIAGSSN